MNIKIQNQSDIVEHYGIKSQLGIATEECAELIQAISKIIRANRGSLADYEKAKVNLEEEIADVIVCIDQLKYMFNISDARISELVNFKIHRQLERIKNEDK